MAYNEELAERMRAQLKSARGVNCGPPEAYTASVCP